ncbi:MAG: adenylate/guanylate cyclase domain-containing protein [Anaerolineae bacterium]
MSIHSRRLAVIMVGDIVGFTAHMAMDEREALAYVGRMRRIIKPLVSAYDGQWIKDIGDGFLASFDSAVEAVECAVAVQHALRDDPAFQLRLGVHLGDVVFEDSDVLGDGVNVAARLEMLAVPGEICASGQVVDLLRNQPDLRFARLGVTNLPHSVEAYAIATSDGLLPTAAEALAGRGRRRPRQDRPRGRRRAAQARRAAPQPRALALRGGHARRRAAVQRRGAAADDDDDDRRAIGGRCSPAVLVVDAGHARASRSRRRRPGVRPRAAPGRSGGGGRRRRAPLRGFNELLKRTIAQRGAARSFPTATCARSCPPAPAGRLRRDAFDRQRGAPQAADPRRARRRCPSGRPALHAVGRSDRPRHRLGRSGLVGRRRRRCRATARHAPRRRRRRGRRAGSLARIRPRPPRRPDRPCGCRPATPRRSPRSATRSPPPTTVAGAPRSISPSRRWRSIRLRDRARRGRRGRAAARRASIADHIGRAAALTDTLPAGKELVRAAVLRARGDCPMAGAALEAARAPRRTWRRPTPAST